MRIFGLDFNANPDERTPIVCASCVLEAGVLHVNCLAELFNLESFENFLNSQGPWTAGIDFPFGQPRRLVKNLGWPMAWEEYVGESDYLGAEGFDELLDHYRLSRAPCGDQHLREVDTHANATSAAPLYRIPIGRMFQRGAPALLRSPVSVLPCRPNDDNRVVVETYPALVSSRLVNGCSYKSKPCQQNGAHEAKHVRDQIVDGLATQALADEFGVTLKLDSSIREEIIEDDSGAFLDSVLCAVQAAWANTNRELGWGIPNSVDVIEGWIADPALTNIRNDSRPEPHRKLALV